MQWSDEALIVGARRHGETSLILELMTSAHGRHLGLLRGGGGRALRCVVQPGNRVAVTWRARLEEQLGAYAVEPVKLRAGRYLDHGAALHGVAYLGALLRLLPERDPHGDIFDMADAIAESLDRVDLAGLLMARFEVAMLAALGFGLELDRCALTGDSADLAYVSPRTGRAVGRAAGAPWADRLLPCPALLRDALDVSRGSTDAELAEAFRLTGHFLAREVLGPRGLTMPPARALFLSATRDGR